jgi:diaminohydroxyphosphoribosylaminopyrimidine deaminase/5-amino-6-(5-phosphoribosylamino)uracil reductase
VVALELAGALARGATAYVTLEPCSHHGRTPPCAVALVSAGVSRVVAAVRDPNPNAAGGLDVLREAGIETRLDDPGGRCAAILAPFLHWARTGLPYVVHKAAMTLDGKTASASGESKWITGPCARSYVHRLRFRLGAVIIGVGTALADDPLLTIRREYSARQAGPQPARVVVDSHLRLSPASRLVQTAGAAPLIVACCQGADREPEEALKRAGAEVLRVPEKGGRPEFAILLAGLGARGITGILLEGGGELAFSALEAGCINEVLYFVAPTLMGGRLARTPLDGAGFLSPQGAVSVGGMSIRRCGVDWVIRGFPR